MRRKRRNKEPQIEAISEAPPASDRFDDVLNRELDAPTIIELDEDGAADDLAALAALNTAAGPVDGAAGISDIEPRTAAGTLDSTDAENALLRAELLVTSAVSGQAVSGQDVPAVSAPSQGFAPQPGPPISVLDTEPPLHWPAQAQVATEQASAVVSAPAEEPIRWVPGFEQYNFWDRYEEATASAELFAVPPAAITVVIGSLDVSISVAERCQDSHWVSDCDVFVLTEQEHIPGQPTWTPVRRPSDLVAVLEDGESDFPLLVIDVPRELPAWIRPLVARLRTGGIGLVHYVLGNNPSDEDLATWHGELGRPAVLDLAAPVPPERVLELLDRGEPISSVAGMPISTELLLALRLNNR